MARSRTPQKQARSPVDDDEETNLSISSDDDLDDDEDADPDEDEDADEDRGDDHEPTPDEDEDADPDEEEEEGDPDEDDPDADADEDEDEDADLDEDALREIGRDDVVPRARLNEVLEEVRQLREQIGGGGAPAKKDDPPAFDVKAKTKERNEKLLEGDIDAASAIDDEIAEFHRQQAASSAAAAAQQVIVQERVAEAIVEIQQKYPVLNDKKRAFDRDVLDEVVALRNVYIGRGDRMDVALRKAAKRICERVPDRDDDGEERRRKPKEDRNTMTLRQKREAMRRARQQPPAVSRHGASGRPAKGAAELSEDALRRMPDAKFKQLDQRDKAAARGDFVGERKPKTRR